MIKTLKLDTDVFKALLLGVIAFTVKAPLLFYKEGDQLRLRELNIYGQVMTGRELTATVKVIMWIGPDVVLTVTNIKKIEPDTQGVNKELAAPGANNNGLDVHYLKKNMRVISRDLSNYTPAELNRALIRLANTIEAT